MLLCGWVGNIYFGKVVCVLFGMQLVFIDIGFECVVFLYVVDIWYLCFVGELQLGVLYQLIEKIVFEGQMLMVQVIKDLIGMKGVWLLMQVSIVGCMFVYLLQELYIGILQKIESEVECEVVCVWLIVVILLDEKGGYIVWMIVEDVIFDELVGDVMYLCKMWVMIVVQVQWLLVISLLYQDFDFVQCVLCDFVNDDMMCIQVDLCEMYICFVEFVGEFMLVVSLKLYYYMGEWLLFDLYNIEMEIQCVLLCCVDFKLGGYLMIDQIEVMMMIDVNMGGYVGVCNFDDMIFKINFEVVYMIVW